MLNRSGPFIRLGLDNCLPPIFGKLSRGTAGVAGVRLFTVWRDPAGIPTRWRRSQRAATRT